MLVEPGDSTALAGAIAALLCDPATAMRMGRTARLRAKEHFSFSRMVDEYEKLYQQLAAQ